MRENHNNKNDNHNYDFYKTNPNKEQIKKTDKDINDFDNSYNNLFQKKTLYSNTNTTSAKLLNQRSLQYPSFKGNKDYPFKKLGKFSINTCSSLEKQQASKLPNIEYQNISKDQIVKNKEKENICIVNSHSLKDKESFVCEEEKDNQKNKNINSPIYKVMKKIQIQTDEEMKEKIEKKFETAEEYLKHDNNIIFGKKLITSNFSKIIGKKPYHIIGKMNEFLDLENKKGSFFTRIRQAKKIIQNQNGAKLPFMNNIYGNNNPHSPNSKKTTTHEIENNNMEFISDEKIQMFFEEKKLKKSNLHNIENEVIKNVDIKFKDKIKNLFNKQNNIMEKKDKAEQNIKKISKNLALKVNKNEDELLFNSTDGFRLKKEIQSAFEQADQKGSKFGYLNDWAFTLRESINKYKKEENKKRRIAFEDDKNKKDKNKNENKLSFSPLETKNSNLFTPLKITKSQGLLTTNSFFNPMNTETRFIQVNPLNNGVIFVSLNDPLKKKASANIENNIYKADKIRKPEINQNKYLKNFINCNPVKEKLKEINYLNSDMNNIGNLIVIFLLI
jgi:hypothetical protein